MPPKKRVISSPGSVFSVPDSETDSDPASDLEITSDSAGSDDSLGADSSTGAGSGSKRRRIGAHPTGTKAKARAKAAVRPKTKVPTTDINIDIEDLDLPGPSARRPHSYGYHHVEDIAALQCELLEWFEGVREKRGMPWRKRYDPDAGDEEKGQRAYEVSGSSGLATRH